MHYFVRLGDDEPLELDVGPDGLSLDGEPIDADLRRVDDDGTWVLRVGTRVHRVVARRGGGPDASPGTGRRGGRSHGQGRWDLLIDGVPVEAEALDARTKHLRELTSAMAGPAGPTSVVAPMPGMVMKIEVAEGEVVEAGDGVVIVEAMKMENELVAEGAGRVTRIAVAEGDAVEKGQVLVEFEAVDGEEEEA